jgi:hypothetical protein
MPTLKSLSDDAILYLTDHNPKPNRNRFLTSGICKLKCHSCNNVYVGQSASEFKKIQECLTYKKASQQEYAPMKNTDDFIK